MCVRERETETEREREREREREGREREREGEKGCTSQHVMMIRSNFIILCFLHSYGLI